MTLLKHLAISLDDISEWCRKNNKSVSEGCSKYFKHLSALSVLQIKSDIPIFTVYLLHDNFDKSSDDYILYSEHLFGFFSGLLSNQVIHDEKVKISIFGKWYNLPGRAVEALKNVIEGTKDYDRFFLNFCINYDGQEELVDACKLIAKQVQLGKIDPDMITKNNIKENIYSSYFLPPDAIFIYGEGKFSGLLLWDSADSKIVFANKPFMEFDEGDIVKLNHNIFK